MLYESDYYCPECDAPVDEEGLCEDCEEFVASEAA